MKKQLYGIFDTAAGVYQNLSFASSDAEVQRNFGDLAVSDENPIGKHPEDYSLFRLGIFDDNTGTILDEQNECLCTALEAIAASRNINPAQMDALEERLNGEIYKPGLTD